MTLGFGSVQSLQLSVSFSRFSSPLGAVGYRPNSLPAECVSPAFFVAPPAMWVATLDHE